MDNLELRKRRLSLIKPLIYWRKHQNNSSPTLRGDGESKAVPLPSPTTPNSGRESSLSNNSGGGDFSATPISVLTCSTTTTTPKHTKVERRASGASKFLRSLRSHTKDSPSNTSTTTPSSKEHINFIALKELDADYSHTLSPLGKGPNPGYSSTALRKPGPLEISRSQSFQEKRLLVSSSTSHLITTPPTPPSTPLKVKHCRAQSFVCNSASSSGAGHTPKLFLLKQQQNIYSVPKPSSATPQNVNGLPLKCETIYENLDVIREQQEKKKKIMAIDFVEGGRGTRRPLLSRKITTTSETNYADYMNIPRPLKDHSASKEETTPTNATEGSRKLRRSISEVPSERIHKMQMQQEQHHLATKAIYSNGLSVWKLDKQQGAGQKNSAALYSSPSTNGLYHSISSVTQRASPCPTTPTTLYSTLPRNHNSSLTHDLHPLTPTSNGKLTPIPAARSTPNLFGRSNNKLQIHTQNNKQPHPVYREPPIYTPVNSLGRVRRPHNSPHPLHPNFPGRSRSSENVKVLELVPPIYGNCSPRKLSTASSNSSTSTLEPPSPSGSAKSVQNKSEPATTSEETTKEGTMSNNGASSSSSSWLKDSSFSSSSSTSSSSSSNSTPVRDSSSLKHIRYGPGHEKYPSWPIPAASAVEVDPAGEQAKMTTANKLISSSSSTSSSSSSPSPSGGSARSKSWTEQTDYPKEKAPSYARPYMKKMNQAYTQQLKTVMEKCESYNNGVVGGDKSLKLVGRLLPPPHGYRDIYSSGGRKSPAEKEYNIPSPPERDVSKPLTQEDVEIYSKKYEEMMSQYAQSEGYHSYISSECSSSSYVSSSSTPFLDLLRRESGELAQQYWAPEEGIMDPNDPLFGLAAHLSTTSLSGRESVNTMVTNSSSNSNSSGNETLKCYGSASDISASSSNHNLRNSNWEQQKFKGKQQPHSPTKSWSPPTSDMSSREINLKKFPLSTYTRPSNLPLGDTQPEKLSKESTTTPTHGLINNNFSQSQQPPAASSSPIIDTSKPPSVAERIWELEKKQSFGASSSTALKPLPTTNTAPTSVPAPPTDNKPTTSNNDNNNTNTSSNPATSLPSLTSSSFTKSLPKISHSETLPLTSSIIQSIKACSKEALLEVNSSSSSSSGSSTASDTATPPNTTNKPNDTYKNIWSGSSSSVNGDSSEGLALTPDTSTQQVHYSYLDPEKKHKVADLTLKAIQKKALLSYYERHNASQQTNHSLNKNQGDKVDKEDSTSERLGFYSAMGPGGILARRDGTTSWNGWSIVGGGAQAGVLNNSTDTDNNASLPPERPPKKPHLRHINLQMTDNDPDPPPPLPRAPNRPPPPSSHTISANSLAPNVHGPPPPPVPSKPVLSVPVSSPSSARSPSPELPPPPPPIVEEEVEVITNDDPLPPPPSLSEVTNFLGNRARSASTLSSYLHKDSYMAQRKERTLGYEGRYRRTLSPSGLGKSSGPSSTEEQHNHQQHHQEPVKIANATSTGKLDTSLTPSGWEKYHNIRPPSTTVIFNSHEIPKSPGSPTFHRSISCDSNLFNNKTGFTQSTIPPPVAQVAPLRDPYCNPHHHHNHQHNLNQSSFELEKAVVEPFHQSSSSASSSSSSASSLTFSSSPIEESGTTVPSRQHRSRHPHHIHPSGGMSGSDLNLNHSMNYGRNNNNMMIKTSDSSTSTDNSNNIVSKHPPPPPIKGISNLPSVKVSPLQHSTKKVEEDELGPPSPVKKSEVSLRVNCTSDVGSQTEEKKEGEKEKKSGATSPNSNSLSSSSSRSSSTTASSCSSSFDDSSSGKGGHHISSIISSYKGRQKTQEELECEELSRHLIKKLPQGDKLQTILVPLPEHKTTADYMEGLFQLELKLKQPEKQEKETNTSPRSSPDLLQSLPKNEGGKNPQTPSPIPNDVGKSIDEENVNEDSNKKCNGHAPLPADSPYFTTSECKAKFLTQYVNDMNNKSPAHLLTKSHDSQELQQQKEMLVSRISRKLEILRTEQLEIRQEIQSNEQLGHQVVEQVKQSAKRNEFDKFKLHVEEIEKITSLLLGLSGRLARAENALMSLVDNSNPQDKKILESKRDKLKEQLDEAKVLKENIDRRSAQVATFLQRYLTVEDYADYHHFVKMKAKLIIDAREIDEKIKLGEEQMVALKDTLNSSSS